jgi:UDP-glucuronate 4-epimerase
VRALVTGVAGFIGSHLGEALVAAGNEVVGLDAFTPYYPRTRKESNLATLRDHRAFSLVEVDLCDADLVSLVAECDAVFHLAAQPGVRSSWNDDFPKYEACNVLATHRLLEAARVAGDVRVIYASSSAIYGVGHRGLVREDDVPRPHSPYGVTKLAAEHLCRVYAANWGTRTVALRYFSVYGPRQRPDMAFHRFIEMGLRGQHVPVYGDGSQVRDFTFVSDVVSATVAAADRDLVPGTTINVAGGSVTSITDALELLGKIIETPLTAAHEPPQPGDVMRTGGATERAEALLGWRPTIDLESGLQQQVAWHEGGAA